MELFPSDWGRIFIPEKPLLELVARGTVLYLGILILARLTLRRSIGKVAGMDMIFLLLLAEAAAHSMGGYESVGDGIVLILVFIGLNFLINFASYRVPFVEKLVSAPAIQVVKNGRMLRGNMRREFLTEEELMTHLRQEGIEGLSDVKAAYVEEHGTVTVITNDKG